MGERVARLSRRVLRRLGYELRPFQAVPPFPVDFDPTTRRIVDRVRRHTRAPQERIFALCRAIEYLASHGIPGAVVECGVWRGGSMLAAAEMLVELGDTTRELLLFDTYEGMSAPGPEDIAFNQRAASDLLDSQNPSDPWSIWCVSALEEVKKVMALSAYPAERITYVVGKVEDTLPAAAPAQIALLRLDTDWYESTRHELEHLYPRLVPGGVLIVDDYGHWQGARQAVDEYMAAHNIPLLLHRVDYSCRMAVKPGEPAARG